MLPTNIRGTSEARRGVLVKLPKPGQRHRIDLPTIGVRTVERAAAAGLAGIAVAGRRPRSSSTRRKTIAAADRLGLFIAGITPPKPRDPARCAACSSPGEPSGDALGEQLMRALREMAPGIEFEGVGGPAMAREGLVSLFPIADTSRHGSQGGRPENSAHPAPRA